jgi:hypothetical protein
MPKAAPPVARVVVIMKLILVVLNDVIVMSKMVIDIRDMDSSKEKVPPTPPLKTICNTTVQ